MKQVSSGLGVTWWFKIAGQVKVCKLGRILMHKVWV